MADEENSAYWIKNFMLLIDSTFPNYLSFAIEVNDSVDKKPING